MLRIFSCLFSSHTEQKSQANSHLILCRRKKKREGEVQPLHLSSASLEYGLTAKSASSSLNRALKRKLCAVWCCGARVVDQRHHSRRISLDFLWCLFGSDAGWPDGVYFSLDHLDVLTRSRENSWDCWRISPFFFALDRKRPHPSREGFEGVRL